MRRKVWRLLRVIGRALGGLGIARVPLVGPHSRQVFYRLRRLFTPPVGNYLEVSRWGIKLVGSSIGLDDPDLAFGEYEVGTKRLFESILRPGMIVADAGANIGYYTVLASRLVGRTGRVFAFECDPLNLKVLKQNVDRNQCENVLILSSAVSSEDGTRLFFSNREDPTQSSLHPSSRALIEPVVVETVKLDSFFARLDWPRVDLVKLDIEGAELAALRGMRGLLSRNPDLNLIVEYAPTLLRAAGVKPDNLLDYLWGLGYAIRVINDDASLTPIGVLTRLFRLQGGNVNFFCTRRDPLELS